MYANSRTIHLAYLAAAGMAMATSHTSTALTAADLTYTDLSKPKNAPKGPQSYRKFKQQRVIRK